MKNRTLKIFSAVSMVGMLALGSGCNKIDDFGTTNDNPNATTAPLTSALLTNTEARLVQDLTSSFRRALYCQYLAETQYTDVSTFSAPIVDLDAFYSGSAIVENGTTVNTVSMQDLQVIISRNTNADTKVGASAYGSNANQIAVATILKAYIMWKVTDSWGDVPYSEAFGGSANTQPAYDKQEDIYFGVINELKNAVATFDAGAPVKGDIIFDGDNAKWKKVANTIRMHMALRMSKRYPAAGGKAAVEFAAAVNDANGIIESNADNLVLNFPGSGYYHPWYFEYNINLRVDYSVSKTIGDCLAGLGDNRGTAWASNGNYFPYGLIRAKAESYATSIGGDFARVLAASKRTATSPYVVLNASSTLLARAEGIERGWIAGSAVADYNSGVAASFSEWGVTMPANYLTTGSANYATGAGAGAVGQASAPYNVIPATQTANTPTALARIQLQRWLSTYPNGNEGWAEWRRTDVPALKPTTDATNADGIPRRLMYGPRDYSLNPAKLADAIARLSDGDKAKSRVWWDQ